MENQAKRINQSLDDFVKGAIDAATDAKKEAAAECFKRVVKKSPVWSGPYVKSHKIGVGKIDRRAAKSVIQADMENSQQGMASEILYPQKMSSAEAAALKSELNEFETRILLGKKVNIDIPIYVSNSVSHASEVEYIGWKKTGPYHVYGLTAEEMKTRLSQILKLKVSQNADLKK